MPVDTGSGCEKEKRGCLSRRCPADFHVRAESRKRKEGHGGVLGADRVCGNESRGCVAQSGECFGEGSDPSGRRHTYVRRGTAAAAGRGHKAKVSRSALSCTRHHAELFG